MDIDLVREIVGETPHMHYNQAKIIREFILENNLTNILELGFKHGVSTCFMASALDERKTGHITTIDLCEAGRLSPNIEELLKKCELSSYVSIYYEPTSYIWRMMKMLEEDPKPRSDFCYLDGAHNWFVDGFAFFLVDRLLKPGGWIIFDDLNWTYEKSRALRSSDLVKNMPEEEKTTPQIKKVYELLVKPHPSYSEFIIEGDWAYAKKNSSSITPEFRIKTETFQKTRTEHTGIGGMLIKIKRRLAGKHW